MYVIGGWGEGKARGVCYEYDPDTDKWTKKTSMPRPAHHSALAASNGKIYVCGGFVPPEKSPLPIGAAWQPIDNVWEYDPSADSWKELAPLPGKRGSALAVEVRGKIHVIGGATTVEGSKAPFFTFMGPCNVLSTNDVYDPTTNTWESRKPMAVARNHAFGAAVNGKIYVIGGRTGHAFMHVRHQHARGGGIPLIPQTTCGALPKERMPTARSGGGAAAPTDSRIYVAGGEVTTKQLVGAFRGIEAYDPDDQLVGGAALQCRCLAMAMAGAVIGNRFYLVSGMIQSAGALVMQDPHLHPEARSPTASADILELPGAKSEPGSREASEVGPQERGGKAYTRYDIMRTDGASLSPEGLSSATASPP